MPKRTAAEAAQTRRDLIVSARELFGARGFGLVSVHDIANRAGHSVGALYHHFHDKAALFVTVLDEVEHEYDRKVREAGFRHSDMRTIFLECCRASLDLATRPPFRRLMFEDAASVVGMRAWFDMDARLGIRSTNRGLMALHKAGYLTAATPSLGVFIYGGLTEAAAILATDPDALEPFDVVRDIALMLDAHRPAGARWSFTRYVEPDHKPRPPRRGLTGAKPSRPKRADDTRRTK